MNDNLGYEDGRTYYCAYWGQEHTVKVLPSGWIKSTWADGTD